MKVKRRAKYGLWVNVTSYLFLFELIFLIEGAVSRANLPRLAASAITFVAVDAVWIVCRYQYVRRESSRQK